MPAPHSASSFALHSGSCGQKTEQKCSRQPKGKSLQCILMSGAHPDMCPQSSASCFALYCGPCLAAERWPKMQCPCNTSSTSLSPGVPCQPQCNAAKCCRHFAPMLVRGVAPAAEAVGVKTMAFGPTL